MEKGLSETAIVSQYREIPTENIVESVIDELEAFLVEGHKQYTETGMKVYWGTGEMLRDAEQKYKVNISDLVLRVASDNRIRGRRMGSRNLWYAVKIYDYTEGDFEKLFLTEFGQNITVNKLKQLITTPRPKKEKTIEEMAAGLVANLGAEKALELAEAIKREVARQQGV